MPTLQEIILVLAVAGILGGWALGRLGARRAARGAQGGVDTDHRIRSLEAELRVAQRKAQEAELAVERTREESETLRRETHAAAEAMAARELELQRMQRQLADECTKTNELRVELAERAQETIRATVRARDAENELGVVLAGSDAVLDQIRKLAAEREELTDRLRTLQQGAGSESLSGPADR